MMIGWQIYTQVVLTPLGRAAGQALENIPEEELEEERKPLFIPFPLTTQQLQPQPYRGSDPEWQEFIKFSKDQGAAKRVRDDLAKFVLTSADQHPVLSIKCGKGMKLRRYWLDVDFPQVAPPEFVRSGIEISDDYIAWAQQPVDSLTVFRQRQALWPTALAASTWSFTKIMVEDHFKRAANMLGFNTPPPPSLEQILAQHHKHMKNPIPSKEGPPSQLPPPLDSSKPPGSSNPSLAGVSEDEDGEANPVTNVVTNLQSHFMRPMMAFRAKLSQTWKPVKNYPPRGSILVSGFVEVDAPKAWLVFDVKAAWDPKEKDFDARSMHVKLRRFQLKKQGPAGGA